MEGRSGGSFQFDGSWAPLTPYKTIHSSTQPIHAEMMQQNQQNQVDWLGIERSATGFAEINGEMSTSEVVGLGAASAGKGRIVFPSDTLGMCIDSSLGAVNHWSMPFADLLALADAASTADRNPGHSRVSFPNDHIGSQAASSSASMLLSANNFALGSSLQLNGNCTAENNGLPYPRHHLYDLNFPPAGMGSAACGMNIHKFAPLTPEKVGMEEINQVSEIQNLLLCEEENLVRNENEGAAETVDANMLQGPSQPVTDSSVLVISSSSKDNHNSEGGIQKIDLNKTPQQKPRRRKHRPKVVREDKPKATPKSVAPKTASSKDNPTGKRKYVRKKGVDKPTTFLAEASDDPADPDALKPAKNSCRRALKFSMQEKWECESSTQRTASDLDLDSRAQDFCTGGVRSKSSVQGSQGIELVVESTQAGISCDLTCTENIVINESSSLPEGQVSSTTFQNKTNMVQEILDVRENDQVTVLDTQIDTAKNMLKNTRSPPKSPNDSTSGTSAVLITEEVQTRRSKRKYSRVTKQASNTNTNGAHYNNLQAYSQWLHFPNIFKKKRSEKGQNSVTSTTSSCLNAMHPPTPCCRNDAKAYPLAPKANYWNPNPHLATTRVPAMLAESEREVLEAKRQTIDYLLASTQQERLTKKRSKVPTRVRDLASLNRFAECHMQITSSAKQGPVGGDTQRVTNSQQPHSCIEALVADMQPTMAKKKRSKKIYSITSTNEMQLHHQMVLYKHHHYFARSSGARADVILKDLIDAVTEQFKYLDINREGDRITYQQRNALVPYNQDRRALVLYKSDGTVVPFQGPFSPIKKRRPRPKVELDEETSKVWRLLLENINNEGIDGTDEEKRRWWEEERRVFRGRADSFIARMHLVQGDRRFSRWKGSVVDSVIGVFLTQNVSDHLSSSAFMSLAARYPLKSESSVTPLHEEEATLLVKEAEVCILDSEQTTEWKNKMSNLRVCDQSSMTFHDNEHNEEKEVVDSNLSPGISTVDGSVIEKIHSSSLNSFESDVETYRSSTTEITRTETLCFADDKRAPNDVISSQNSVNSSQNFVESSIAQTAERIGSCSETNSEAEELKNRLQPNSLNCSTSFMELLKMAGSTMLHEVSSHRNSTSEQSILTVESGSLGTLQEKAAVAVQESSSYSENNQSSNIQGEENIQSQNLFGDTNAESLARGQNNKVQQSLSLPNLSGALDVTESSVSEFDNQTNNKQKTAENKALKEINAAKQKSRRVGREIKNGFDWDTLRREAEVNGKRERTSSTLDSLDWDAVRCADVNEIADTIKERGMNNMLAERIKAFLNRLVKDHGSIDLEWLRDISPDQAKEYLLSIRGLGLKSVECVRLLTLHHLAFPVDTNVGRIAVRLGWVPLQPLPESLQLHLLELYPVLESIQKYLWPRLCKLEQKQLYELHYQMITFGKVFCTKSKPNCNACPMRGECRHFASAFASARLALPAPEEKSIVTTTKETANPDTAVHINGLPLPPPQATLQLEANLQLEASLRIEKKCVVGSCEPIIEEPASPEPESTQDPEHDIEDTFYDDPDEIPTIKLNIEEFTQNLQNYMEKNMELQEGEMSKALVALNQEAASIPMPKLKNVSQLRTEHQVYELPDSHPLLEGMDKRETDDPCSYLLAIWTPGETADSIQPPEAICTNQEFGKLCDQKTCFACNSTREANSQMVRGTLLIPCRTAMRGSFPLNGTYFQVNEVFADHDSSLNPIDVPRAWLWNLPRRTVYFGTSVPSIFKGLPTEGIQHCFWRGYVCVRGFDQKTRAPRPLMARLHFPASKLTRAKGKTVDE